MTPDYVLTAEQVCVDLLSYHPKDDPTTLLSRSYNAIRSLLDVVPPLGCPSCGGRGAVYIRYGANEWEPEECETCEGTGQDGALPPNLGVGSSSLGIEELGSLRSHSPVQGHSEHHGTIDL